MTEKIFNLHFELAANGRILMIGADPAMDMPWEKADDLARALTIMARRGEEYMKRNAIVMDNALLQRSGASIGLSDRADIKTETIKAALWDRDLRRWLPWRNKNVAQGLGNIRTRGAVPAPALTKHKPN